MGERSEKNFIENFVHTFEMYSYGNALYGRLCAHILLGQKLRNIKLYFGPLFIDPRISLFLIQPSGTGKSTPYSFIKDVGEKAGLKVGEVDQATDAALIGHVDAEEVSEPESKTKSIKYNIVKGKMADYDILHYDEGKMLITRGPYAEQTISWFQKALNPIGSGQNLCTKSLAHGTIEFYPSCSFLITSHEIENLLDTVLDTGFFQRIILYPRYIPIDERKNNEFLRADRFCKRIFTEIDIESLSKELMEIGAKYEGFTPEVDGSVYPIFKSNIEKLYSIITLAHERVREIMATFVPRYDNLLYIFALHHSCVNFKKKIDIEDVKYASLLMSSLFNEIMAWVEENISLSKLSSKEQSYLASAYTIYKAMQQTPEGYVVRISFLKLCSLKWRISMNTVNRYIEKFIGFNKIKEIDISGVKMIKVEI